MFNQIKIFNILKFINENTARVNSAKNKLTIFEGELQPFVAQALANELSVSAYERAVKRIAPINMLPKIINKLSTLYNNTVVRTPKDAENVNTQEFIDHYVDLLSLDNEGRDSNKQLNLNKYTSWEIYISEDGSNEPRLRVLPANQFLVYSDNIEDPTVPTVCIKILGPWNKESGQFDDLTNDPIMKEVVIYKLYDVDQIIVIDSDGELRPEFMVGNEEGINPYGIVPFVYIRNAKYSLLPKEDTSDIPMTILIPLLLTDLNYATQFMSHSIIYSIDAEISNMSGNPDSVWTVKSDQTDIEDKDKKAQIGTIKPEVDIDKVLKLIQTQLALWLDSKGLKAQGVGSVEATNLASGISKMIDEADTTQAIISQTEIYRKAEKELWDKLAIMHNIWVDQGFLSESEFNKKVEDSKVNTVFEEPAVVVDEEKRIETIKLKEDSLYISHKSAIAQANPELSDKEIEAMMEQIKSEQEENRTIIMEEEDERQRDDGTEEPTGNESRRESGDASNGGDPTRTSEETE